jgi:hypothetical protein
MIAEESIQLITSEPDQTLNILHPGITYVKIMEYFQDEKDKFKDKYSFDDVDKFVTKYFDVNANMKINFIQTEEDDNLQLGKIKIN